MGDFNNLEGLYEIPIPGSDCPVCAGKGITLLITNTNDEAKEEQCEACGGKGYQETNKTVRLRKRLRNMVKAEYEDWLEYRARRRVFDMRNQLDPNEFKESMSAVAEQCAAGTFSWAGTAWQTAMAQPIGQAKLYHLLMMDADRLGKETPGYSHQKYTDGDFLQWIIKDVHMRVMLAEALAKIVDASPNFLHPPVRGLDD